MAQCWIVDPDILLMDEPFSALDVHTRMRMEGELLDLWTGSPKTILFVTHDLEEALAMSDRIVVMRDGLVEQTGRPDEIYSLPRSAFVADFIGTMNVLDADILETKGECLRVSAGAMIFEVSADRTSSTPARGAPALNCIRPEELSILPFPSDDAISAQIVSTVFYGPMLRLFVEIPGGQKLMIDTRRRKAQAALETGSTIYVRPTRGAGRVLSKR